MEDGRRSVLITLLSNAWVSGFRFVNESASFCFPKINWIVGNLTTLECVAYSWHSWPLTVVSVFAWGGDLAVESFESTVRINFIGEEAPETTCRRSASRDSLSVAVSAVCIWEPTDEKETRFWLQLLKSLVWKTPPFWKKKEFRVNIQFGPEVTSLGSHPRKQEILGQYCFLQLENILSTKSVAVRGVTCSRRWCIRRIFWKYSAEDGLPRRMLVVVYHDPGGLKIHSELQIIGLFV